MRKIIYVFFCILSVLTLASCNKEATKSEVEEVPTVEPEVTKPVTPTPSVEVTPEPTEKTPTPPPAGGGDIPETPTPTPAPTPTPTEPLPTDDPDIKTDNGDEQPVDKEARELYVCIPEDRSIRVLQLADIHFGIEGKDWHNDKVDRTKQYISYMIETEQPDLIVCSGDNILGTGVSGLKEFVEYIEGYETPWIWLYGNHDAESAARKSNLSKTLMELDTKYLIYKQGYIEAGYEDRYGNFSVNIYNSTKEKLLGAFIILDAGEYDYSLAHYRAITAGQIEWYKGEIDRLQALYAAQEDNKYDVIPTIVFAHIQLPEYITAYEKAAANDGAEFIIEQELKVSDIEGGPDVNTGMFDAMVEKGSTKAYFVGHAHTIYFQVKYQGIVLGFAPQTGFSKLFANNDAARKTYMYSISEDLSFETKQIDEIVKNQGLVYTGTSSGQAKYNESAGTYTFTVQLPLWGRVSLDYYGPELTAEFTKLTLENTTVTGEINMNPNADWTSKLYCSTAGSGVYLCSSSQNYIYRFTYTVSTNTLHIELVGELDMESGEITAIKANRDSELSLWKKAGATIITESSYATSDGKRLFIIVDSEGRIAYSVYNHKGEFGDPTLEDVNYYYHPYYAENENPAIVITETGYKIVIPEGGFAITADGDGIVKLAKLLINPSITSKTGLEDIVNNLDAYKENLRLSYDSETKVISATYN